MGCIYNNWDGECSIWDKNIEMQGCDERGICVCDDDPNPEDSCEDYNSDSNYDDWEEEDTDES